MNLRPYQIEAINQTLFSWQRNNTPLIAIATGGGKTFTLSNLLLRCVRPFQRALIIAHTQEIIYQLHESIQKTIRIPVGIIFGDFFEINSPFIVASRQSLQNNLSNIGTFDFIIIDEAHHASLDNTYGNIISSLSHTETKTVGFTATPHPQNNSLFDEISFSWSIDDGIKSGFLVPPIHIHHKTPSKKWPSSCLQAYKSHCLNRPCLAFFSSVKSSKRFANFLNKNNIPSAHIDGTTDKDERSFILSQYKKQKIKVICNMQVLTEGFDAPETSAILLVRLIQSPLLLTQIIGRGLRKSPQKNNCAIIHCTP